MVRLLHMSDSHDDTAAKLLAAGYFAKSNSIDAIVHSGDITGRKVVQRSVQNLQRIPQPDEGLVQRMQSNTMTEEDKQKASQLGELQQKAFLAPFIEQYQQIEQVGSFVRKEICPGLEVYTIMGNHDIMLAPEIIKSMQFVDLLPEVNVKGITIKGTPNTDENPYGQFGQILGQLFMNYGLGMNASKDPELRKLADEDLKRLMSGNKPDLVMLHKELYDPERGDEGLGTSAQEFLARNKGVPVICGHLENYDSFANYKGNMFMRVSPGTFTVIEMDEKTKKIKYVDIYRFVPKQNKQYEAKKAQARLN